MKNKRSFKFVLILIIILIIVLMFFNNKHINYYIYTKLYFESISPNQIMELLDENNKSKNYILVGRKTCPSCINSFHKVKRNIKETPYIDNIYYYDTDDHRKDPIFEEIGDVLNLFTVPTIIIIEDGKIILNQNTLDI